ncbi:hypothetical protein E2C01_032274 [Portunus trituberculatus]|uniref:Uncharacterized protein n=1 Tax=Portunus trituberculatus TaxID=210409 RepID=A0A5B7EUX6_PORTR|nr:hypothetical protein [Portunus trituberculatus]
MAEQSYHGALFDHRLVLNLKACEANLMKQLLFLLQHILQPGPNFYLTLTCQSHILTLSPVVTTLHCNPDNYWTETLQYKRHHTHARPSSP